MKHPNILYIHSHDTGRYVQPYGHDVPAPNIQQLAEQGVLFRQNFCAAPTCSPSRAALLTGQCGRAGRGVESLGWGEDTLQETSAGACQHPLNAGDFDHVNAGG